MVRVDHYIEILLQLISIF